MQIPNKNYITTLGAKHLIKEWTIGVPVEESARQQLLAVANLPFIFKHIAVMPDVHTGMGSTIGSVIPTMGAIIPAAVGVDIGCGMNALQTTLKASDLPKDLSKIRLDIESAVPHGRSDNGGINDVGAWQGIIPENVNILWEQNLSSEYNSLIMRHNKLKTRTEPQKQLGTLGTGNHFIEICLDENDYVWIMLHSGSRGIGNRIGSYFIQLAKNEMNKWHIKLEDASLAYLPEDSLYFNDYITAVQWAQKFARYNREVMMDNVLKVMKQHFSSIDIFGNMISCHHNFVTKENHYCKNIWITRKGAIRVQHNEMGIIPGSMGAQSYIVTGLGNKESYNSASHGAGRIMSRTMAKKTFSLQDHEKAVKGIECRIDNEVIDETPAAYKNIDHVMAAQSDLVKIVHKLHQVICVKG